MVSNTIPKDIVQWNCRNKNKSNNEIAISFYCTDQFFQPVISNPDRYVDELSKYHSIIGMDASPFDNMPPIVQCSQVFVNLAITYYFGRMGLKIIPNVRLGDKCTYSSLEAYPRNTIISIGTNGFVRNKENFKVFVKQFKMIVKKLQPNFVLIYGTCPTILSNHLKNKKISFCVYESFIHKRRAKNNEGN